MVSLLLLCFIFISLLRTSESGQNRAERLPSKQSTTLAKKMVFRQQRYSIAEENFPPVCQAELSWSFCASCIMSNSNNTWCSRTDTCFSRANATNRDACYARCGSNLVSDLNKCEKSQVDIIAVVFSFLLLIMCPLCVISGCIYVIAFRCRGSSKIHVAPDGPLPVLLVSNASQGSIVFADVPAMAEVELITDAERPVDVPMASNVVPVASPSSAVVHVHPLSALPAGQYATARPSASASQVMAPSQPSPYLPAGAVYAISQTRYSV